MIFGGIYLSNDISAKKSEAKKVMPASIAKRKHGAMYIAETKVVICKNNLKSLKFQQLIKLLANYYLQFIVWNVWR